MSENRSAEALERIDEIAPEADTLPLSELLDETTPLTARDLVLIDQPEAAIDVNLPAATKELIRQINPDATGPELEVFFYHAGRTGLDPIARQIYLVRRSGRMVIQTGVDGYRLVAARSGLMAGSDDPVFENTDDGQPVTASVTVHRIAADGIRYPYTATARWAEYAPQDLQEASAFMWRKMPHTMLGKCAETLALRKAFPAELSGLYTDVEMDQAGPADTGPRIEAKTSRHLCPMCEEDGKQVPVIDNRERHLNPGEGKKAPPAWKCANGARCAKGDKWGWGVWDLDFFDNLETGADMTRGRPSMAGLLLAMDTPVQAVRKWLAVQFQGGADEAGLFWTQVQERHPLQTGDMDGIGEEQALVIEGIFNVMLDEWEAPMV